MTPFDGRLGRGAGLAGAFGGIAFALLLTAGGTRQANAVQKDEPKFTWIGAGACQGCHNQDKPLENPTYKKTLSYDFIRLQENNVWDAHDMHKQAFVNLLTSANVKDYPGLKANALAQRMEGILGQGKKGYTVITDARCLACHASSKQPIAKSLLQMPIDQVFDTSEGVGCEMCHGHGSKYRNEHANDVPVKGKPAPGEATREVPWRAKHPLTKSNEFGLTDLRDPATATATCASCHVGSQKDGRFVTHEMYAAGHPPLPPLDLMAYSREQPRHWGLPSQMPFITNLAEKDAKKAWDTFHYRSEKVESSVTRRFVESSIAALRSTAALTLQLADEAKPNNDGLDFAAFDCYSCHHDLKYPSDRQARGYDGPPGRPQFRVAPFALARTVVGDEELGKRLDAARRELAFSFGNRSYGDPAAIAKAVASVNAWCDDAMKKVQDERYTAEKRKMLLDRIIRDAAQESPRPVADPELAQLYLWAVTTISLDIEKDGKLPAEVEQLRKTLGASVVTRLRPGLPFDFEVKADAKLDNSQEPVSERISERMSIFNAFKGDVFRGAFKK
jgi:hypothetical protein